MSKYSGILIGSLVLMAAIVAWVSHDLLTEGEITPNDEFFELSIGRVPDIDGDAWSVTVGGHVDNPTVLTLEDLRAMPAREVTATLKCVEGPSGTAVWKGVPVRDVLDLVVVREGAVDVVFHAADGYDSSLDLEDASQGDMLLCYEMNGERLPRDQGYPLKLVAPGKAGYKWVKWIVRIEVVDYDHEGYWESRGWDDEADLAPLADWAPHALLLSLAAILGGLAVTGGLGTSRETTFWRELPDYLSGRFHTRVSVAYLAVLYPTFAYWVVTTLIKRGGVFYSAHGIIGLLAVSLHTVGLVTGYALDKGSEGARRAHLVSNTLGYLMLLGTIALGILRI